MSGGGGETRYVTNTTSSAPPGYVQDAQKTALNAAVARFNDTNAPAYFPGQTYVDFSPETQMGLDAMRNRAVAGSPLQNAGQQAMMDTVGGNFLSAGNPYFQDMLSGAFAPVMNAVNTSAAGLGRFGSGAHTGVMTERLGRIAGDLAFQNYGQERANQMQAATMAPQYAAQDYADMQRLVGVGAAREGKAAEALADDMARYTYEQNLQDDKIARLMALASGGQFGGTQTGNQPIFENPTANLLGMGATAAGIGSMLFGAPGGGGIFRGF